MALSLCRTTVDDSARELMEHGTAAFPIACYHDDLQAEPVPWHWHEELELIHIISGTFHITINETTFQAGPGDVLLVNSGFLHGGTPWDCIYECLVFPVSLLFNRTYNSTHS